MSQFERNMCTESTSNAIGADAALPPLGAQRSRERNQTTVKSHSADGHVKASRTLREFNVLI